VWRLGRIAPLRLYIGKIDNAGQNLLLGGSSFSNVGPHCQGDAAGEHKVGGIAGERLGARPKQAVGDTLDEQKGQNVDELDHPLDGLFFAAVRTNFIIGGDGFTAMYTMDHKVTSRIRE